MLEVAGDLTAWLLPGDSIQFLQWVGTPHTSVTLDIAYGYRPHFLGAEHGASGSTTQMISRQARILMGCQEVPGYGGASTASYKLFEMMQNDGLDVHYLNLISGEEADYFRYMFGESVGNPKCLANVYTCVLRAPLVTAQPELTNLIRLLSPDRLIGIGGRGAVVMKRATPEKHLIFMTTGFSQMRQYIREKEAEDFISLSNSLQCSTRESRPRPDGRSLEQEAVMISDLIITHSEIVKLLYQHLFSSQMWKVYHDVIWFSEWICQDALGHSGLQKPFDERDIDLLFIAGTWTRPEKNYKLLEEMVSRCKGLNINIIGEVEKRSAHARHHGLIITRGDLFTLMGRAKTVVSPSLFDAAPGILFEASVMGCNIIASKNCGNWRVCNANLLVDPFHVDNFVEKISISLSQKYEDNLDYFLTTNSYQRLIDAIFDS